MCQTGDGPAGLKLVVRAVNRAKADYNAHAWGSGAYYMEAWGAAALEAGDAEQAEEAFLEALAHDPGCVRAAFGLKALCDRLGRADEAARYEALARKCWAKADAKAVEGLRDEMAKKAALVPVPTAAPAAGSTSGR